MRKDQINTYLLPPTSNRKVTVMIAHIKGTFLSRKEYDLQLTHLTTLYIESIQIFQATKYIFIINGY